MNIAEILEELYQKIQICVNNAVDGGFNDEAKREKVTQNCKKAGRDIVPNKWEFEVICNETNNPPDVIDRNV